ncbi:MAG: hypothetical protein ACRDQA_14805 [Nocardioidaceae bacterium]
MDEHVAAAAEDSAGGRDGELVPGRVEWPDLVDEGRAGMRHDALGGAPFVDRTAGG